MSKQEMLTRRPEPIPNGLTAPNHSLSKPARIGSRPDQLRRISAKSGWYAGQRKDELIIPDHYKSFQIDSYIAGYDMAKNAPQYQKHPFGEIDSPRVPA